MNKFLHFLVLFFLCSLSYGQYVGLDWGYALDNQQYTTGTAIQADQAGNTFIAGLYEGNLDLDPGPGTHIVNSGSGFTSLFIKKVDASGNFLWGHNFDLGLFTDSLAGKSIGINGNGDLYLTGLFSGTVDFDPGPNTFNLTANNTNWGDFFVLKLDGNGNFLWAKNFGGTDYSERASLNVDASDNVILAGYFYGTIDFDPGAGSSVLNAGNNGKFFIQKLDSNGDFQWVKEIGNGSYNSLGGFQMDSQDNLFLSGRFSGTLDLDPGAGTSNVVSLGNGADVFVLKLDNAGDFVWGVNAVSGGSPWGTNTLDVDQAGVVYLAGDFQGSPDFDPGTGVFTMTSSSNGSRNDGYLLKLDNQGAFVWAKQFSGVSIPGNNSYVNPQIIRLDQSGQAYMFGYYQGTIDFDPGPGSTNLTPPNRSSFFIVKLNQSGDLNWALSLDSDAYNLIRDVSIDTQDNIYVSGGFFQSLDIDPGQGSFTLNNSGNTSMFAFKWTQDSCSNLAAIIDSVADVTCGGTGFASGYASGGTAPYMYSWNNTPASTDTFANFTTAGTYEFTVTDASGCSRTSNILVNGPTSQNGLDLVVNITSTPFRTGFPATIWIDAFNDGCQPVTGEVVLVLDPFLSYNSSSPPPDTIIGDSLIWYVSNMNFDSPHFMAAVDVTVSLNAGIGDRICLDADISPKTNDTNTKNNTRDYCRDVINAYDPNDKLASPQGLCEEGYIEANELLTYTVRFQNTGNADAINIFILDTLDQDFDINSLKVVGQSHKPMITEILADRVLKFRFDNIHLPDSTTDEKNSHGYVMFEVAPLAGLPVGTELTNTAGIYFDFNEPVITNTVFNTITDVLPTLDTSYVSASSCNSYTLNGRTYTQSGSFVQQLSGTGACDSVVILNLSLQPLDTSVTLIGKTLTANEGGAHGLNVSYQWVDCDNNNSPISGATQQSFTPEVDGNYAVIISRDNCSEISACTNVSIVGIDPDFQSQVKYYPNPSQGRVEVELGSLYQEINMNVLNALGQKLMSETYRAESTLTLDLPQPKGIYFVQIEADGKQAVIKIIRN
ncbi:MAG: T9SS type A sorting domain-containing protein [Bacteroidia bacterium]|nr:T9SS type A sorting domain-containing protein [Bacteroidia bacterium]